MPQLQQKKKALRPRQKQAQQPGLEHRMDPQPESRVLQTVHQPKLAGQVVVISGGDSGIGRAVALAFAEQGAKTAILYLNERKDAEETVRLVKEAGSDAFSLSGDIGRESFCQRAIAKVIRQWGRLDIVINNAAEQHPQDSLEEITAVQLERTFRTNIFSYFFLTKAALPHLKSGSSIINTTSVTAYRGSASLIDYSSTKGAIVSFTRALAHSVIKRGIRVNAVAPGPVWTPLIPASFPKEKVETFGSDVPLGRAGQPNEIAPCYVFLASAEASYITGQVLHPNGGEIING
ncbi:NAD(P)-dependent dehydrogenase (short-subunit alcohol dehydrogenase family) [Prosthecobacter fusiformis]|uniref:NAD(P)-dependent dehydrogenase (Short-subunit alcohol dehydrogenase family) n=1 Tax=Prosthecobacter fusiformis TaxID=48464 RepID=A0A4V3FG55_9BACT|nr:SDR family oxidoreductase [Prosthecobacter fusiformis]TDU73343.1 NAD(P)-dependent dehydrogenase (short-subunit alcohol dehydrogenase family) [Prosthecobacter fusiformis]